MTDRTVVDNIRCQAVCAGLVNAQVQPRTSTEKEPEVEHQDDQADHQVMQNIDSSEVGLCRFI